MSEAEEYDHTEPDSLLREPPFLERVWVRRTILYLSLVTSVGIVISQMKLTPANIVFAFLTRDRIVLGLIGLIAFCCIIISIFDFFGALTVVGILLKVLAIGHAECAIFAMFLLSPYAWTATWELVLSYLLIGWLWLMFALAYLGGDASWTAGWRPYDLAEPVIRVRKPPFFARVWVRRTLFVMSFAAPYGFWIALMVSSARSVGDFVAGAISILFLTGGFIIFCYTISVFDPLGWPHAAGIIMKVLAIGHALSAMYAMFLLSLHDWPPALELMLWYLLIGWLWLMFALAYLGGDAYWTVVPRPRKQKLTIDD